MFINQVQLAGVDAIAIDGFASSVLKTHPCDIDQRAIFGRRAKREDFQLNHLRINAHSCGIGVAIGNIGTIVALGSVLMQ